jgi:hypothetical protein
MKLCPKCLQKPLNVLDILNQPFNQSFCWLKFLIALQINKQITQLAMATESVNYLRITLTRSLQDPYFLKASIS